MNWLKCADQILSLTGSRAIKTVQTIVGANQEGSNSIFWPGQQKGLLEWRRVPTKYLVRRLAQLWRRPDGNREHITEEPRIDILKCQNVWHCFSSLMTKENTRSKGGLQSFGSAAVDAGRRADQSHDLFRLTTREAMVQLRCSAQRGPIYFNTRSILFLK